ADLVDSDCWKTDSAGRFGSFVIEIEVAQVDPASLLNLLAKAQGRYITPTGYPGILLSMGAIMVIVEQPNYQIRLTPEQLKAAMLAELLPFTTVKGVSVWCNHKN